MFTKAKFHKIATIVVMFTMLFSALQPSSATAQGGDGIKRETNAESGRVSFIGPESGRAVSASRTLGTFFRSEDPAMSWMKHFGPEFGLTDPERNLSRIQADRSDDGRMTVRYQQNYNGIPVMGGELIVNTNGKGDLYSINGEISPNLSLQTQPTIDSAQAADTALTSMAKWYQKTPADFVASEPELWIYDESLLQASTRPTELVWRMEVTAADTSLPVRELVLVDAQRGGISLHFNQVDAAWTEATNNINLLPLVSPTCTIQNGSGSGDVLFRPYVQYNCGYTSYGVGTGDFNNDGRNDVALSVNEGPGFQHTLLIFLQDTNGNLSQPVSYSAGMRVEYLAVGDFNNDGRDDVVTLDYFDGTISVYLQNNSGTLNNRVTYSTNASPDSIAVGDVNNDGLDDVVISHWSNATIGVFTQKNDGTLNSMVAYPTVAAGYGDIAIGDVNNDGLNDVVKMNGQGNAASTLVVHTQDNSHTLNTYTLLTCSSPCMGRGIEIGDVTGDGRADIVMSYGGNRPSSFVAVFSQDANGNLQPSVSYSSYDIPDPIEIADMNSDNKLDVVVLHSGWGSTGIYPQQNNGTLGPESLYSIPYKSWYYSQDVSIGDVNNDGLSDILVADGQGLVILYRRTPAPNTIAAESGTNQVVLLQNQFSQPLKVKMRDFLDRPVTGVTVTFTAPASGASAVFSNTGTNISTAVTDANGIATSSTFSANNIHGSYVVSATVPDLTGSVDFQLANVDPSIPMAIQVVSGSNQTVLPQTPFPLPLKVLVQNYLNQPMAGITVTFTAPASGASGIFAGTNTNTATAVTGLDGIATSPAFSANGTKGGYTVKATVSGLSSSADFQLFNGTKKVNTYTANNGTTLPGTFLCNETKPNCTNGANPHADAAHKYAMGTYDLYAANHARDSINNAGMAINSTVHYRSGYANAFWSGAQMVYGDYYGFPLADDVVAHELTHGVTQYESNLFYYYQSGAINESFSDLWGEFYDQVNGLGNDTPSVKWLAGEDVAGSGAIRSMSDPTSYGDPDRMTSGYYFTDGDDNGGVHENSGVNNKAVFLMVDGGTFNGKTVTPLGWEKTAAIYYEANSNLLTSGADYSDLYYALQQACTNLVGRRGITADDCVEVKDAADAVEMNLQPYYNFNPEAPLCSTIGTEPYVVFSDDLEGGTSNWTFTNGAQKRWQYDSAYGPYAQSGLHSIFADDYPAAITDAKAQLKSFLVPANAYLHFAQAYDFEADPGYYWDGGVLEYSTNNGSTWTDAGSLIDYNGYNGSIYGGWNNPLKGRSAFTGSSHGYISTRLNLATLAGQNVFFRWRMGLDDTGISWGWWVDNIRVYRCFPNISGNIGVTGVTLSYTDGAAKTVTTQANGSYVFPVSNNWSGTVTPSHVCFTFSPASRTYSNVTANQVLQNYTATINAGCADVNVKIGGNTMGSYALPSGGRLSPRYGINGGPVHVYNTAGKNIFTSQRAIYGSSFNSIVGFPANQLTTEYWFTTLDDLGMITYLVIGNPNPAGSPDALVDVYIGGVKMNTTPYSIAPGARVYPRYGINGGPVRVVSTNGVTVFTSERTKYGNSFNEVLGFPFNQMSTEHWFTSYDDLGMITYLVIGNPNPAGTPDALVDVYIAGVKKNTTPYSIAPGARVFPRYGINGGPVQVVSTNGVTIFTSERSKYGNSFNEVLGFPLAQASTELWFTSLDDVSMITYLVIGNPNAAGSPDALVDVYINGVKKNTTPYSIPPGGRVFPRYGINDGPVRVVSTNGVKVFTSERTKYLSSFNEILGIPNESLTTEYWYTSLDDLGMATELVIAAP